MKKTKSESKKDRYYEELVADVTEDFLRRQEERRDDERRWELNLRFLAGDQYCELTSRGEIEEEEKRFYWQSSDVYNHIAPIIDSRISRLTRVRPIMSVRASGTEESDIKNARLASALLDSAYCRLSLGDKISKATEWSETCGSAFYYVGWNSDGGKLLGEVDGKRVYEGDVFVEVVSPFEIFPDSLSSSGVEGCESLIRARAMRTSDIERQYGVVMEGESIDVFSLNKRQTSKTAMRDSALVIERYERPNSRFPNGRTVVVSRDKLLFVGELPYENGIEGRREIPFVMQNSIDEAGRFFGASMIERLIPAQRAYNDVKNRKKEYMNRLSMGVVAVEDGSVDVDDLAEEGLSPGKIIVYRQGSEKPSLLNMGSVPSDLAREEDRLLSEFILLSGVSEFSRSTDVGVGASGVALQLLMEQEDSRLNSTSENVRAAVKESAKRIIRMFKQFASNERILKVAGDKGKVELYYFNSSNLTSDDVVFDTENELSFTPAQKKTAVYELISAGLLSDADGKMSERTKAKVLEILGFGSMNNALDVEELHRNKAQEENISGFTEPIDADEFDDHEIHVEEHTRYLLSTESEETRANEERRKNALEHLRKHKRAAALDKATE